MCLLACIMCGILWDSPSTVNGCRAECSRREPTFFIWNVLIQFSLLSSTAHRDLMPVTPVKEGEKWSLFQSNIGSWRMNGEESSSNAISHRSYHKPQGKPVTNHIFSKSNCSSRTFFVKSKHHHHSLFENNPGFRKTNKCCNFWGGNLPDFAYLFHAVMLLGTHPASLTH